ncbi:NAD(P)/FAD-dependent oxidoreductase [Hymenobacter cellulosilyticus]|uniref:NAD(P)/FAD-dependent oxidoreductase n=1 Tax=Hymenobacter cellulosilyticus TaxID=2932248 RepID=UPI0035CBFC09
MAALPIAVLGSGPAGSACAIELLRLGHAVVLIDRGAEGKERRGETCGPRVEQMLLGQGTAFTATCHHSFDLYSSAWGTSVMEGRQIAFWQAGVGSVLDRSTLHNDLVASACAAGAVVLSDCHVQVAQWTGRQWVLQGMQGGKTWKLAARFVVEATGRQSSSVCQPDAKRVFLDKLQCLVTEFAAVEDGPSGWLSNQPRLGGGIQLGCLQVAGY